MAETECPGTPSDIPDDLKVARQGIAKLLNSERYSDCKITCQGQTFSAHKAIVCTRSPVISAAMDGQFLEATTSVMALDQFNPGIVKRMLIYLYTEEYEVSLDDWVLVGTGIAPDTDLDYYDDLRIHIQMHAIADYLEIPELREHSLDMIVDVFDSTCPAPNEFVAAMREILDTTQHAEIQEVMVDAATDKIDELMGCEEFDGLELPSKITMGILRNVLEARPRPEPEAEGEAEEESKSESEAESESESEAESED